ncbi:MAG: DUF1501 domain-containing protein [Planctomycetes bacterium]|nr:DUF1501 domain-containing protein [Planctomycetota bacterium]
MNLPPELHRLWTRRRFFARSTASVSGALGAMALASGGPQPSAPPAPSTPHEGEASGPHFAPRARSVISLHMEGGPSHLDLFDYKPGLQKLYDQDLPDSVRDGQRLTGMTSGQKRFPVAPSMFAFKKWDNGGDGVHISELMPYLGTVAEELCVVRSMHTEAINHEPAITFVQTGHQQPGRPSFGAWASYGLGSGNHDLPTFVVMITQGFGNMQALAARFWGSGFLPSQHQGCKLRSSGDPVLFLRDPNGVSRADRRQMLDLVAAFAEQESRRVMDPEIQARLLQQEMAYRMQMSVPELTDVSNESESTYLLYGEEARKPGTFAHSCLLARRLVERGVRFVQLYMRGWDQHGNLPSEMRKQCVAVDRPIAGLITDLRRRGMLDETLVTWGGEFGRTVYSQGGLSHDNYGRDHHPRCFSVWMAGGGVRRGHVHGETCDFGYNIVRDPVSVHDLHATLLHVLGFDHERLVFRHQGREFRLTDVSGRVVHELLA